MSDAGALPPRDDVFMNTGKASPVPTSSYVPTTTVISLISLIFSPPDSGIGEAHSL
jgi:hypothetical protein